MTGVQTCALPIYNTEIAFNISLDEINKNGGTRIVATSCRDVLDEYLSEHQHLNSELDGRLTVL